MKLKNFTLSLVAIMFALSLFMGCATTSSNGKRDFAPVVKQAAFLGTYYSLKENPDWRDEFEMAANQLEVIAASERLDFSLVIAIASTLPVKELQGSDAKIIITSAQLILADYGGGPALDLNQSEQTRAIVSALAVGIRAGLQ